MKHLKLDTRTPNVVYLRITTWVGSPVVMCAEHWYGKLSCGGSGYGADRVPPEEVEVEYVLTKKDAARLNKEDEWATYKAGGKSTRFFSKESLIDAALSCWKQHFPSTLLLIEGDPSVWEPQPILDGPSSLMVPHNDALARVRRVELGKPRAPVGPMGTNLEEGSSSKESQESQGESTWGLSNEPLPTSMSSRSFVPMAEVEALVHGEGTVGSLHLELEWCKNPR